LSILLERASDVEERLRRCSFVVALAGQPNVGKSTLFNRITGEISRVGNFPGTTIELLVGRATIDGVEMCIVDLPGTYGLSASSLEERVARSFLLSGLPRVVIVIVDSTLPERTLYLAIQILEMFPRVVIALTKWDIAHREGVHIHVDRLEALLGAPVVPVSGLTGEGVRELLKRVLEVSRSERQLLRIDYGALEPFIELVAREVSRVEKLRGYPLRWVAIRLLEGDEEFESMLPPEVRQRVEELRARAREAVGMDVEEFVERQRYSFIDRVVGETVVRVSLAKRVSRVDKVFTHPVAGPVASVAMLFTVFLLVFAVNMGYPLTAILSHLGLYSASRALESYSLSNLVRSLFQYLSSLVYTHLRSISAVAASLLAWGVIGGVGVVLSFLPLVFTIMLTLSVLEDSGLGPRMATALHSMFSRFGLSGRGVYPLLIAFGCNVPAVMASRAAVDEVERLEIALSVAFVPCQARLVVLAAFVAFIFAGQPHLQAAAMVTVLLGGVLLYLLSAKLFRKLLGASEPPELLLEIPPMHRPSLRVVWWNSWDLTKHFLKKAGLLIFFLSLASWALLSFGPTGFVGASIEKSFAAYMGRALAPLFHLAYGVPLGSAWRLGFATIVGFFAKEGILSVLAQLGHGSIASALQLTPQQAFAALLFFMYYLPCLATAAVIYQETESLRKTVGIVAYMVSVALAISVIAYRIMTLL